MACGLLIKIAEYFLMLWPVTPFGAINDLALAIRWESQRFALEVDGRASFLTKKGITSGSTVALVHGGSAHFLADLLALWSLGATVVCLDPALTKSETSRLISFSKAELVLVENAVANSAFPVPVYALAEILSTANGQTANGTDVTPDPETAALILFTSGTTGEPKGVVLSYNALQARLAGNREIIGSAILKRSLVLLPAHFGHGLIGNVLTPLFAGGDVVFPAGNATAIAAGLGKFIDQHEITFFTSVPAFWKMVLRFSPRPKRSTLKRVHVGSAPLMPELWNKIADWASCEVVNCYGMTETANWFAGASSHDQDPAEGLVGLPWGGAACIGLNSGGTCPQGEGEILVRGAAVMSGYLFQPELTRTAFRDGWYRTGDFGRIDDDGKIWLTGRIKDEINRAGFKIQPLEIDQLLESHPDIAEACTFALPDSITGELVAVAVCLKKGVTQTSDDLRAWCEQRLRPTAIPERWFIVDEIPRTTHGKLSRTMVRETLTKEDT